MFRLLLTTLLLAVSIGIHADELNAEKKAVIDEMLQVTGALKMGEAMGAAIGGQMISALAQQQGEVDPKIVAVTQDEINQIMHDEFIANGLVNQISYDIYHRHFTTAELREIVAFYKSPTGAKAARLAPEMMRESMMAGQKHVQTLDGVIRERLAARFAAEGIK